TGSSRGSSGHGSGCGPTPTPTSSVTPCTLGRVVAHGRAPYLRDVSDSDPTVVILVAHGSRNPRAAEEHEQLCDLVERRLAANGTPAPVRAAYLEIASPSIPEAIAAAVASGAATVQLLPHFL